MDFAQIRQWWRHHPLNVPVCGRFVLIRQRSIATGEVIVAATQLAPGVISNIPVVFFNAAGEQVAAPTGGAAPIVTSDALAAGSVAIGADGASVDFTPEASVMAAAVNITATFTRADGVQIVVEGAFQIGDAPINDTQAVTGSFNAAGITTRPLS